ncbi:MAG: hypothetical protein ACJAUP_003774 [Cellvibrionaceae bacterium]|jgi:hypothetical protein
MKKYIKYGMLLITVGFVSFYGFHISYVLYDEVKTSEAVKHIFEKNNYKDISLSVCHEGTCNYDFGLGNEQIKIYSVGRENIESRIQLAREIAKEWSIKNHLCKTFYQNRCRI